MTGRTELERLQRANLGHVLFTCARLLDELAQDEVNAQAGQRVARPALLRLLPFLGVDGVRPTELAKRVDVSKQAIHQSLAELERQGLIEYTQDPVDGRARLVRLSAFGEQAFAHGLSVLDALAAALKVELGTAQLEALAQGLQAMLPVLERWKVTPPDLGRRPPAKRAQKARGQSGRPPRR